MLELNKIYNIDCLEGLKQLADNSIDMVMTSPPYWSLRSYSTNPQIWDDDTNCDHEFIIHHQKAKGGKSLPDNMPSVGSNKNIQEENMSSRFGYDSNFCIKCGAWKGELGLEPDFNIYIKHLCDIFDDVKRVLKKEGTCWINIGDTYYGTHSMGTCKPESLGIQKRLFLTYSNSLNKRTWDKSLHAKSLCNIPARFSIEMQNRGWILRNIIIWHKNNCMPSSVKDRFTVDFEYLFFFTKSKKYYFKQQFDKVKDISINRVKYGWNGRVDESGKRQQPNKTDKMGKRWVDETIGRNKRSVWNINTQPFKESHFAVYPEKLCETPIDAGCPENGIVLDPFSGSGTTCLKAYKINRNYIGFELNPEYCKIAEKRLEKWVNNLFNKAEGDIEKTV